MPDRTPRGRQSSSGPGADRALSEVLSYAFIFSMIVVSIGIVTVGGLGTLQDARTHEHAANAERAFDVLHDNLGDVHQQGAPSRATEIALGDAQLYLDDNVTLSVELNTTEKEWEIRPVVFNVANDRQMVYTAGATLQRSNDGGVVVNEPPFLISREAVHIPVIQTSSPAVSGVGSGTVLVRGQAGTRSVVNQSGVSLENVSLETPRADIWGQYFQNQGYCARVIVGDGDVTCTVSSEYGNANRVVVTEQQIHLTLIK